MSVTPKAHDPIESLSQHILKEVANQYYSAILHLVDQSQSFGKKIGARDIDTFLKPNAQELIQEQALLIAQKDLQRYLITFAQDEATPNNQLLARRLKATQALPEQSEPFEQSCDWFQTKGMHQDISCFPCSNILDALLDVTPLRQADKDRLEDIKSEAQYSFTALIHYFTAQPVTPIRQEKTHTSALIRLFNITMIHGKRIFATSDQLACRALDISRGKGQAKLPLHPALKDISTPSKAKPAYNRARQNRPT